MALKNLSILIEKMMKLAITTLLTSVLSVLTLTAHANTLRVDKENINNVCQSDARMANCQDLKASNSQ